MTGEELLKARKRLHFDQKQMADAIGVSPSQISKWEKDRVKISKGYQFRIREVIERMEAPFGHKYGDDVYGAGVYGGIDAVEDFDQAGTEGELVDDQPQTQDEIMKAAEESAAKDKAGLDPFGFPLPTFEENGFEVTEFGEGPSSMVKLKNKEGKLMVIRKEGYRNDRGRNRNPFDRMSHQSRNFKNSWSEARRQAKENIKVATPNITESIRPEAKDFSDTLLKQALKSVGIESSRPVDFDNMFETFLDQKGANQELKDILQTEFLQKIPDDEKTKSMSALLDQLHGGLGNALESAFGHEDAKPLMDLLQKQMQKNAADAERQAKDQVLRLESVMQRETREKILNFTKENADLKAKIDSQAVTMKLHQETLDVWKTNANIFKSNAEQKADELIDAQKKIEDLNNENQKLRYKINELLSDDVDDGLKEKRREMWRGLGYSEDEILNLELFIKEKRK